MTTPTPDPRTMTAEEIARRIAGRCDTTHYGHTPKAECCCNPCSMTREIAAAIREAEERGWAACCLDAERKAPKGHVLTEEGAVRRVLVNQTNTNGPVYGTAMMLGQTVIVLAAAKGAKGAEA